MEEFKVELENLTDKEKKTFLHLVKKSKKSRRKHINEIYYSIAEDGNIVGSVENDTFYDESCWKFGNYYNTKEEAEFAKQKQLVYQELKRYAVEHNTEEIDWENYLQIKYFIYCNTKSNDLGIMDVSKRKITGQVYFTSEKIAENAIKYIGEDRIKKYLFEFD
jgi:hypothetical protein